MQKHNAMLHVGAGQSDAANDRRNHETERQVA